MDDISKPRKAKEKCREAISSIVNPGAKRRSASTHERSGRPQKVRKPNPHSTPPSLHADENTEDVGAPFHRTPATKRMSSHSGLIEHESIIYATDETQIAAEARGV